MYFGRTRLLKLAVLLCGVVALFTFLPTFLVAAEEEKPIIRTQEDIKRGKQNVHSVITELAELFSDNAPEPVLVKTKRQILPPYSKIIDQGNGRATLVFRPRFTSAKPLSKAVDSVVNSSTLVERLEEQNEVIISASLEEVKGYKKVLEAMDIASPQILIEAKVVEVMFNDGMERNLSMMFKGTRYKVNTDTKIPSSSDAGDSGATGSFTPYAGNDTMNVAFQWLESAQDATVLSSPNILLSRDETSRIVTGEEIPIQEASTSGSTILMSTTFKNVGVSLEVKPTIINLDNVTLYIYPKVSNVLRYDLVSNGDTSYSVPVISTRSVETYLRLHDRQVVMMGGLYSNRTALQEERVPIVSDIPYIGELFNGKKKTKEVTQLLFFLKVHIIPPTQAASGIFYDFDHNAKVSETLRKIVSHSDSFQTNSSAAKELHDEMVDSLPAEKKKERWRFKEESPSLPVIPDGKAKEIRKVDSDLYLLESDRNPPASPPDPDNKVVTPPNPTNGAGR
ncbi:MAG: type II and III secretion system protein [Victivallales bacterium]|nr:type II and III secretion system protein [Victivallales bacterium]